MTYRTRIDGARLMAPKAATATDTHQQHRQKNNGNASQSRQLLHFGAVDWQMEVYINSIWVGSHEGAYDSFFFDITDALIATGGDSAESFADEVLVQVTKRHTHAARSTQHAHSTQHTSHSIHQHISTAARTHAHSTYTAPAMLAANAVCWCWFR